MRAADGGAPAAPEELMPDGVSIEEIKPQNEDEKGTEKGSDTWPLKSRQEDTHSPEVQEPLQRELIPAPSPGSRRKSLYSDNFYGSHQKTWKCKTCPGPAGVVQGSFRVLAREVVKLGDWEWEGDCCSDLSSSSSIVFVVSGHAKEESASNPLDALSISLSSPVELQSGVNMQIKYLEEAALAPSLDAQEEQNCSGLTGGAAPVPGKTHRICTSTSSSISGDIFLIHMGPAGGAAGGAVVAPKTGGSCGAHAPTPGRCIHGLDPTPVPRVKCP
ncbi:unnamed protein product [Pleuronectes platessa]|uniref:Uncharacterized protein n=1 Tax=Pleuronectes platessa TaxID=8262 RepID=A0A9N7U842_PLEPL|nr:unnamed protein product [Pleuronectes platessa]